MVNIWRLSFLICLTFVTAGCGGEASHDIITPEEVTVIDGGFSWWSGPYLYPDDNEGDSYYITGVGDDGSLSSQWLAKVEIDDEGKFSSIKRKELFNEFIGDEHNAPAVVVHNTNIVVALTGHANTRRNLANKVYIYQGKTIDTLAKVVIDTPGPATYVQLLQVGDDLVLFSRISDFGYSYTISADNGATWGVWQPLFASGYVKAQYNKMSNYLDFYIGTSPIYKHNNIQTIQASYDGNSIHIDNKGQQENGIIKSSSLDMIIAPEAGYATRILSTHSRNNKAVLFSEHLVPNQFSKRENWHLKLAVKLDNRDDWQIFTLKENVEGVLGERNIANNSGYYVYGGDISSLVDDNVSIVYAQKTDNGYSIDEMTFDLKLNKIVMEKTLVESELQLYRPLIFNSKLGGRLLMYNEANTWYDFYQWNANQILLMVE
ncbi:MAG: hypothetical protein ACPG52_03565 [Cognaticolwellia sp.]